MATRAERIRVIVFLSVGFALIAVLVAVIAGQTAFQSRSSYLVDFRDISVNGLEIGSTVRYNGIEVGSVEDVHFAGERLDHVVVRVAIGDDVPLREDVKARLVPVGITGRRELELFGASEEASALEPRSRISAVPSTIDSLAEPATNIANELEFIVLRLSDFLREHNREQLESVLDDVAGILDENRGDLRRTVRNLSSAAAELDAAVSQLTDEANEEDLRTVLRNVNRAVEQGERSIRNIESVVTSGEEDLLDSLQLLEETLEYLNNFAITISEDPSELVR
ncbi:MAG: MlaD family protein [Spirochaetota bacterium]